MTDQHVPATATHADMVAGWMQAPAFCAEYERLEREEGPMLDARHKGFGGEHEKRHQEWVRAKVVAARADTRPSMTTQEVRASLQARAQNPALR